MKTEKRADGYFSVGVLRTTMLLFRSSTLVHATLKTIASEEGELMEVKVNYFL